MARPFSNLTPQARERLLNVGMLFALGIFLLALAFTMFSSAWLNDVAHFWVGARTLVEGGNPYIRLSVYPDVSISDVTFHPLPWVLLLFLPVARLSLHTAMMITAVVNLVLLVVLYWLLHQWIGNRMPLWQQALTSVVGLFFTVRCLFTGQLGLWMVVGIAGSLYSLKRGRDLEAGVWIVLLLLKPWVGLGAGLALALLVISQRRWKSVLGFAAATAVMVGATLLAFPSGLTDFLRVDYTEALGGTVNGVANVWPLATPIDFFQYVLNIDLAGAGKIVLWAGWISLGLGLAVWTVNLWRRGKLGNEALVGVGALLGLMLSPYVRYYDYALLFIWVAAFGGLVWARLTRFGRVGLGICMALAVVITFGTHPEPWVLLSLLVLYGGTVWALEDVSRRQGDAGLNADGIMNHHPS